MSLARYGFLPWVRQGISDQIKETETAGEPQSRPTVDVSLTLKGKRVLPPFFLSKFSSLETLRPEEEHEQELQAPENADAPDKFVFKTLQLLGPGDITGIKASAVVKTEPLDGLATFEPNYLPYVEFYEEDFPWRFTPYRTESEKLQPWLVLVVLDEEEFERRFLPGAPLPAITHGKRPIAFPPWTESWAWAHVHVNHPLDDASDPASALRELVDANPNLASSRLLCPRRLKPNTSYTAFLLPAFEQGRLAGLGAPPERIHGLDMRKSSWSHAEPAGDLYDHLWPVYYEWSFRTGDLADFEYLVRRIEARVMEDPVGRRPIDLQDAGYELRYNGRDGSLLLEGALQLIGAQKGNNRFDFLQGASAEQAFIADLQTLLNLNTDLEEGTAGDAPVNQTLYIEGGGKDDPIVTPPLYGQWHAGASRADAASTDFWFNELNLDPRNRMAAGFGTLVVRRNQDAYMDRAWEQVGEVLEAQRRIRRIRFSAVAGGKLQARFFEPMDETAFSAFSSSVHERLRFEEAGLPRAETLRKAILRRRVNTVHLSRRIDREQLSLELNGLEMRFYQQARLIVHARTELIEAEQEAARKLYERLSGLDDTLLDLQTSIDALPNKPEEELTEEEQAKVEDIREDITDLDTALEAEVRATADDVKGWRETLNTFQNKPQELREELRSLLEELDLLKKQLDGNLADRVNALEAELEAYGAMDLPDDQDDEASQSELEQLAARMEQLDAYLSALEEKFPGQPDGRRRSSDEEEETPKENLEARFAPVSDAVQAFFRDVLDAIDLNTIDELHACIGSLDTELTGLETPRKAVEKELGDLAAFREDLIRRINQLSRLYLPPSALRQDYRKLARPNGPAFRRVAPAGRITDPVRELGKQIDQAAEASDPGEIQTDFQVREWEEISWGGLSFGNPPSEASTAQDRSDTSTSFLKRLIRSYLDPVRALQRRLNSAFNIPSPGARRRAASSPGEAPPENLLTYPEYKEAMYAALAEISSELVLPNVQRIPMDTFSLLEVNQRFIEAYLLGLNHEMARELLWREYPTDQRGSYFRRFWDDLDNLASTSPPPDIERLTELAGSLGENAPQRPGVPDPDPDDPNVVFVIRSELLKKFPNVLIYMQRAAWQDNSEDGTRRRRLTTGREDRILPIFKASIYPEVSFYGFPVTAGTALGSADDPGWFFVVQERPGEPRFGLDIGQEDDDRKIPDISQWNDLNWGMVLPEEDRPANRGFLSLSLIEEEVDVSQLTKSPKDGSSDAYTWGKNAAHMAGILLQLPFMVAVHATDMIKIPKNA